MITKASPADAGCWIDGHWGQYSIARMVGIAERHGFVDEPGSQLLDIARRKMAAIAPSTSPDISVDEEEYLYDSADDVEAWLNENVAPEGYLFAWQDGEFFLSLASDFEEDE